MATFYNKERAKYGHLTGQVVIWPVEYEGTPDQGSNPTNIPAGYLKCDGTKYFADDYPQLASILGTGEDTKFIRKNIDGTNFDTVLDGQFMVPDFSSKYPEPTTGANAGLYNNCRVIDKQDSEKSRSGIGIEAISQVGTTNIPITYRGTISVPAQELPITGKPGYTYAGTTHRTESTAIDEDMIHPHMHRHNGVRARNMTFSASAVGGATPTETNNTALAEGRTGLRNASTIKIEDWLDNTLHTMGAGVSATNPPGSGQEPCRALKYWNPNGGFQNNAFTHKSLAVTFSGFGTNFTRFETIYSNGCIEGGSYRTDRYPSNGPSPGPDVHYGSDDFFYGCILKDDTVFKANELWGAADGSELAAYANTTAVVGVCAGTPQENTSSTGTNITQPKTYASGLPGVPTDFNGSVGVSLHDVLPLQSNDLAESGRAYTAIEHVVTETDPLTQTAGDPTIHNHRVRIEDEVSGYGRHDYKVKTRALAVDPENLKTTMSIGESASASIDSATAPFIIMEYLIKV